MELDTVSIFGVVSINCEADVIPDVPTLTVGNLSKSIAISSVSSNMSVNLFPRNIMDFFLISRSHINLITGIIKLCYSQSTPHPSNFPSIVLLVTPVAEFALFEYLSQS